MRRLLTILAGLVLAWALLQPGAGHAHELLASALLQLADGRTVGLATFTETTHGEVRITLDAQNLPPGAHGFHIHEVGSCDPPNFASPGGHFNPLGGKHGLQTSSGPHAGDLPDLVVGPDGRAHFYMVIGRFTLHPGQLSLLDADGSAVVVHAMADDQITDPSGNSGQAIACGVVQQRTLGRVVTPAPAPMTVGGCPASPGPGPDPADRSMVVIQPRPGDRVSSPVRIAGLARVFEATVSITIMDEGGHAIADAFTTAAEAGPTLAPFATSVPFKVTRPQAGCIRVFEASAKDGSPVNVVQVPVTLLPGVAPPSAGDGGLATSESGDATVLAAALAMLLLGGGVTLQVSMRLAERGRS